MKHILCSNGNWIDGISSVPKIEVELMTVSSAYIDLFRGVNPGCWRVRRTPRFCAGGRGGAWGRGVAGGRGGAGGRGWVVKYYHILSCTGSMFESGDF